MIRSGRCGPRHRARIGSAWRRATAGCAELAGNTDGAVVLNTNQVKCGVSRMMADLGPYYLMQ